MPRNSSPKLAVPVDPKLHESSETAAAREALQQRSGLAAVELWEKQHGRFTLEEMDEARRKVRAHLRGSRIGRGRG